MKPRTIRSVRENWGEWVLVALPAIACLAALPFARGDIPMQWNLQGKVTWYAPKSWGLPLLPGTLILIDLALRWLQRRDPLRYRETDGALTAHGKATRQIRLALMTVLGGVSLLQIAWSLGYRPEPARAVLTAVALLIAFIGNQFGKLKPNSYVGIRIPWTLGSENVWRRTHRAAGWVWVTSGLLIALLGWLLPASMMNPTWAYLWLFVLIGPPLVVAWAAARTGPGRSP